METTNDLQSQLLQVVEDLSSVQQAEVLDFVEYLELKVGRHQNIQDERDWSTLSLSYAMRGMEDEQTSYSPNDLKEIFS